MRSRSRYSRHEATEYPNPKPNPNPKPHQVWGEAVTEEMVLDEQMLRGLIASEARGTNGPKELL